MGKRTCPAEAVVRAEQRLPPRPTSNPDMGHELRLAVRRLRQQPAFTAVAVLTLALGLGVNTAIFTIAHALSSQQLPVTRPSELYRLGDDANCCVNSGLQEDYSLFSTRLYEHLRDSLPERRTPTGVTFACTAASVSKLEDVVSRRCAKSRVENRE